LLEPHSGQLFFVIIVFSSLKS